MTSAQTMIACDLLQNPIKGVIAAMKLRNLLILWRLRPIDLPRAYRIPNIRYLGNWKTEFEGGWNILSGLQWWSPSHGTWFNNQDDLYSQIWNSTLALKKNYRKSGLTSFQKNLQYPLCLTAPLGYSFPPPAYNNISQNLWLPGKDISRIPLYIKPRQDEKTLMAWGEKYCHPSQPAGSSKRKLQII